eukprot:scaffold44421_cov26-Tisochrysis_lutea.AAC.4
MHKLWLALCKGRGRAVGWGGSGSRNKGWRVGRDMARMRSGDEDQGGKSGVGQERRWWEGWEEETEDGASVGVQQSPRASRWSRGSGIK